jgi:hypothetical protein
METLISQSRKQFQAISKHQFLRPTSSSSMLSSKQRICSYFLSFIIAMLPFGVTSESSDLIVVDPGTSAANNNPGSTFIYDDNPGPTTINIGRPGPKQSSDDDSGSAGSTDDDAGAAGSTGDGSGAAGSTGDGSGAAGSTGDGSGAAGSTDDDSGSAGSTDESSGSASAAGNSVGQTQAEGYLSHNSTDDDWSDVDSGYDWDQYWV